MESKILYSLASRSRPAKFFAALDNIRDLSNSDNYFVVAKLDDDDPSDYSRLVDYPEVILRKGKSESKVHAINRGLEDLPHWEILCSHSDDMVFIVRGFDDIIRQEMEPDTFLHFPDGFANERLTTYSMMDRIYYERFNYIYHPAYKNVYCDNEAHEAAQLLGRYKFVNKQIFSHEHPVWGRAEWDEQYRKTEEKVQYRKDGLTYHTRKSLGFPA